MANEFIIKNGFHSKGNSQITGSLTGTSGTLNEFSASYALTASHALTATTSPAGNNGEIQFNNAGTLAGNSNFKINNSNGVINMDSGAYFGAGTEGIIRTAGSTLGLNADQDTINVDISGPDGDSRIKALTSGVQITGSITGNDQFTLPKLNVSASILSFTNNSYKIDATNATSIIFNDDHREVFTRIIGVSGNGGVEVGNHRTIISGSLFISASNIFSGGGTVPASITASILKPLDQPTVSVDGTTLLLAGGDNVNGTGGNGGNLNLFGGKSHSQGNGGNVNIFGGDFNASGASGSIFLKGNKINLDNTALDYYSNASNFYKLLNYNSSDECAEIGIVSYTATGGSVRDVKFFSDGEEAFKITGGNGQKVTFLGSRSGQHTEVRATSGSFSYLRGASPLIIDADNFSVTSTGEMSSGTGDGISTTSITASGAISSSGTITGNSFVKGGGTSAQFLKADGSIDSSTYLTSAFPFTGDAQITGSLIVSGSGGLKVEGPFELSMTGSSGNVPFKIKTYSDSTSDNIIEIKDDGGTYDLFTLNNAGQITIKNAASSVGARFYVQEGGTSNTHASLGIVNNTGHLSIKNNNGNRFAVDTKADNRSYLVGLTGNATMAIGKAAGGTAAPSEANTNTISIFNGTNPTSVQADGFAFFSNDVNSAAGTASPTFLTEDDTTIQLGSTSTLANVEITGSLNISGSTKIELPTGTAFEILEGDKDQQSRLTFDYTNGDPTLTVASRASTAKIEVRADQSSTKLTLDENGQIYVNGNNIDGVKIEGDNFHSVGTNTNALDLGYSSRPWKDLYLQLDSEIKFVTNTQNMAIQHINPNRLRISGSDGSPSFNVLEGSITASYFKGDGSALTNIPVFPFTGSANISGSSEIIGSGSAIFQVEGSVGTLFSVDDGLDDIIFAANNISGTPVISANADNTVKLGKLGGFGIVISGSTPAPNDAQAKIIITGSIHTSGSLGVGMAASSTIGRIDAKNDVVAFSTSDERLKDNITPIEDALNKVSQVQGIEFDWIEKEGVHGNEGHDVGVIAQEIEKVLPEVVTTRDNGYKAVKYEKIIPLLVEAIKELQAEVQELKNNK